MSDEKKKDEKPKEKDPYNSALDKEVLKKNLHRVMLENAQAIGDHLIFDKNTFATVVYNHGILNGREADDLYAMLLKSKMIRVKDLPK